MTSSVLKKFFVGFTAPLHSARFLFQKKSLFILGVAPQILTFILYFWAVDKFIIGKWLLPFLNSLVLKTNNPFFLAMLKPQFFEVIIWIVAFLFYGVLGAAFVNAAASPIYDYIAKKSYEASSKDKLPIQTIGDFIDSIISEITKAVVVFCVFIISFFIHIFAPLLFLLGIWYLGWNSIDRTLLLLNLPLKERLRFGLQNTALCVGLGVWSYLPIISSLFAFTTASAGAMLVAKSKIPYFDDNAPGADF